MILENEEGNQQNKRIPGSLNHSNIDKQKEALSRSEVQPRIL